MERTTIPLLEKLGIETFKVSKRKRNELLESLGIHKYSSKKIIKTFVITVTE